VFVCWIVGLLDCWSVGVLECWSWSVEVLECWSVELESTGYSNREVYGHAKE
jgi:hypothetical protein